MANRFTKRIFTGLHFSNEVTKFNSIIGDHSPQIVSHALHDEIMRHAQHKDNSRKQMQNISSLDIVKPKGVIL